MSSNGDEEVVHLELVRTWDKEFLLHAELEDFERPIDFEFELPEVTDFNTCTKGYLVCLKLLAHKLNKAAVEQNVTELHLLSQDAKDLLLILKDMVANTKANYSYFQQSQDNLEKMLDFSSWDKVMVSLVSSFFSGTMKFIDEHKDHLGIPFLYKLHDQFLKIREKKLSDNDSTLSTETDLPTSATNTSDDSSSEEFPSSSSDSSPLPSCTSSSAVNDRPAKSFQKELLVCAAITDSEVECEEDNLAEGHGTANKEADLTAMDTEGLPSPINKDKSLPPSNVSEEEKEPMLTSTQKNDEINDDTPTTTKNDSTAEKQPSQNPCQTRSRVQRSPIHRKKQRRQRFSLLTDVHLIHGVKRYGVGSWATILKNYEFPSFRTAVHLKDRWRTLITTGAVKEDDGLFILVEPFKSALKDFSQKKIAQSEKHIPKIHLSRSSTQNNDNNATKETLTASASKELPVPILPQANPKKVTRPEEDKSTPPTAASGRTETANPVNTLTDPQPSEPTQDSETPVDTSATEATPPTNKPGPSSSSTQHPSPGHFGGDVEPNLSIEHVVSLAIWGSDDEPNVSNKTGEFSGSSPQNESSPAKAKGDKKDATTAGASNTTPHKKRRLWDVEGEVMTWDEPILEHNFVSRKKAAGAFDTIGEVPKKAHKKVAWSDEEVQHLLKGIERYGQGQWAMILDRFKFNNRTAVQLKDKYRNILKKKDED
uniref:Uncharacterized protein LOC100177249 n=1 Tax=Phallusia mammillata TaxID=59560 RepID=A0A6F9DHI3_9ASCI|nr:uncharacterized protein LOC100177249 [Phallusia mammillata]